MCLDLFIGSVLDGSREWLIELKMRRTPHWLCEEDELALGELSSQ